jgi:hypothetical protein
VRASLAWLEGEVLGSSVVVRWGPESQPVSVNKKRRNPSDLTPKVAPDPHEALAFT